MSLLQWGFLFLIITNVELYGICLWLKKITDNKNLKRAALKIKIGIKAPKFEDSITLSREQNRPSSLGVVDLSRPINAYLWGWEQAMLECGELLAEAELND